MYYPKINYLILSHNITDAHRAIVGMEFQEYPAQLKKAYVFYQKPFPEHIDCSDIAMKVYQYDTDFITGQNDWWMRKVIHYGDAVEMERDTDSYTAIIDEDDIYHPWFTHDAMVSIKRFDGVWNPWMLFVDKAGLHYAEWTSAIGTLVMETPKFIEVSRIIATSHPEMTESRDRAPLDSTFKRYLIDHCNIGLHAGIRAYFNHKDSNTARLNPVYRGNSIDNITG